MSSLNKVQLIGRAGKEPEIRKTGEGKSVVNLSLATSDNWKDKSGQKQEKTEWHNIVAFDKLADIIGQYIHKGDMVYFEGKLQTRKWTDNQGQDKYTTEIVVNNMVMLGGNGDSKPQTTENNASDEDYSDTPF